MSALTGIQQVVFVDSRVPDIQDLLNGLQPGEQAFVLDPSSDGVQQIADINVTPVNDAPTASNLTQTLALAEDAAAPKLFTTAPVIADIDSSSVTATLTLSSTAAGILVGAGTPSGAVYTINGTVAAVNAALAAVTFDSAQDFNGTASVAVAVSDGQNGPQGTNPSGTVSITVTEVNDPPFANADTLTAVAEDSGARTIAFATLTGNDTKGPVSAGDETGQALTVTAVSAPVGGTVSLDAVNHNVVFTPTADFNGAASFSYTVTDNGTTGGNPDPRSATATASFTVTAVDDAPVFAHFGTNHSSGTEQTFGMINGAATINDVELDALNGGAGNYAGSNLIISREFAANREDTFGFSSGHSPAFTVGNGVLLAGGQQFATFSMFSNGSQQGTVYIFFDSLNTVATTALVNNVLEHISYKNLSDTPPASVTMHFTFNDGNVGAQGSGGPLIDTANRIIDITAVNDAPVATAGSASGNEDTAIASTLSASDVDNTAAQLAFSLVGTNGGAAHGTVALNANGSFSYTPAADFNGSDSFAFKANDGTLDSNVATESLVIAAVNDTPVITSNGGGDTASIAVAENTTAVTTVHATDIDSPTLSYAISGGADQTRFHIDAPSGVLTFASAPDFEAPTDADHNNSYVVQVRASDGFIRADTQTLTVNVTNVADVVNTDSGFNGDLGGGHKSDLIIRDVAGGVTLWQMNGGQIQSQQSVGQVGNEWHIESNADLGGDGKSDILWRADDGSVALWQMNGAQIAANTTLGKVGNEWHINGTGDFNGDGRSDIFWHADNGSIAIWQMNGSQIQANQTVGAVGPEQHVVGIGDFNGDHNSDILWRADDGTIALWQMNGTQIAAQVSLGKVGPEQHVVGVGDFNGDGQADIVFRNDNGTLVTWQMNNGQIQSSQTIGAIGPEWHLYGTADLNGDGKADILFRNTDGSVAAWEMNGTQIAAQDTIGPLAIDATLGAHHYDLV